MGRPSRSCTHVTKDPIMRDGVFFMTRYLMIVAFAYSFAVMVPVAICSLALSCTVMRRFTSYLYVPL